MIKMTNWHKSGPDFGVVFTMTASGQRGRLIKAGRQMGRFVYPGHFGKSQSVLQSETNDKLTRISCSNS